MNTTKRLFPQPAGAVTLPRALAVPAVALALLAPDSARAEARDEQAVLGLSSSLSGSIDQAGLAASAGAHYRISERLQIGLGGEWNPWVSLELQRLRLGTLNAYGTVIVRPYVTRGLALRATAHVGTSVLLFDLYGAPSGSAGPYLGLSLIGLELAISKRVRLVLDPAHVVLAVPQLRGIPLTHRQYRATVGIELWI
jgi:hypothetical protein